MLFNKELLKYWRNRQLIYINNHDNSSTRVSAKQLNAETIFSRYSYFVLTDGESIHPCAKYAAFSSMCDFPEKDFNLPKLACALHCCSECPGVFVTDAESNDEDEADLSFI